MARLMLKLILMEGPETFFLCKDFKQYQGLTSVQQKELLAQMNEMSEDTNLVFHPKGTLNNPDGKIKFGNFAPQVGKRNAVEVHVPRDPDEPVEAYVRADQNNLNPTANNKGGNALARALLGALGVSAPGQSDTGTGSRGYSLLSCLSETTTGHDFKGHYATRPQMKDLEQLTRLFGRNNDYEKNIYNVHVLGREGQAVTQTISSENAHDTIVARLDTHDQEIDLNPGTFSSVGGFKKNVAILPDTCVEDVVTGSGTNTIVANTQANRITLGNGSNTVVYKSVSDSPNDRPDHIVGFKTGTDKLDVASFTDYDYRDVRGNSLKTRLDIENKADGSTWVKWWKDVGGEGTDERAPDFLLRADGIKKSDVITVNVI